VVGRLRLAVGLIMPTEVADPNQKRPAATRRARSRPDGPGLDQTPRSQPDGPGPNQTGRVSTRCARRDQRWPAAIRRGYAAQTAHGLRNRPGGGETLPVHSIEG
jgi:hypothetical protein